MALLAFLTLRMIAMASKEAHSKFHQVEVLPRVTGRKWATAQGKRGVTLRSAELQAPLPGQDIKP